VEVVVDRFPVAERPAMGHAARSLPINGGEAADLDLLLTEHRLQERAAAPRATPKAPGGRRQDLPRRPACQPSCSEGWQGKEAPALAALSLEPLEQGHRLWLHAPSVAERVAPAAAPTSGCGSRARRSAWEASGNRC
jgi:ribonuclease R